MKIFCMNDDEYWMANSLEEAKADYLDTTGEAADEAEEVSDEDLDRLTIKDVDEDERPTGKVFTFREYLQQQIAEGANTPQIFCCSNY